MKKELIDLYEEAHYKAWYLGKNLLSADFHTMTLELFSNALIQKCIDICERDVVTQGTSKGSAEAIKQHFWGK
jgi:hypothetical protein